MIKLPNTYYSERIKKVRDLISNQGLDALLIFSTEKEDPSFLPWILGNTVFNPTYLLITGKEIIIFIPQWRMVDARSFFKIDGLVFVGTPEKVNMISSVKLYLENFKKIGYAGNAPYKDLYLLNQELLNIEEDLRKLYQIKDEFEIKILSEINNVTRDYLDGFKAEDFLGLTEKDIAQKIESDSKKLDYSIAEISVVSGDRLKETSASLPTLKKIEQDDVICIDLGLGQQTYYSDITRCYFLGESKKKYISFYEAQQRIVLAASKRIKAGTISSNILAILRDEYDKEKLGNMFVETDLGHGLGTGNHEYPEIGYGDMVLKSGMVFTLEPELKSPDGTLLRYEEIFYVASDGVARLCK